MESREMETEWSVEGQTANGRVSEIMCVWLTEEEGDWSGSRFHRKAQVAQETEELLSWMAIVEFRGGRQSEHHWSSADCPMIAEQSGKRREQCLILEVLRLLRGGELVFS